MNVMRHIAKRKRLVKEKIKLVIKVILSCELNSLQFYLISSFTAVILCLFSCHVHMKITYTPSTGVAFPKLYLKISNCN